MQEAKEVIQEVQGTQEAIEDAKMFTSLIKLIAKYSQDTSANERKFVFADYSANIARLLSANSSGKTCDSILENNFLFSMIVQYDCSLCLFSMFARSGRFLKKFFILNWEIYVYKKCYQYEEQIN